MKTEILMIEAGLNFHQSQHATASFSIGIIFDF